MKLDFSVFRRPYQKSWGQLGTPGTINVHAGISVPPRQKKVGTNGDNSTNPDDLSPMSPEDNTGVGTEIAFIHAGVPHVPHVPAEKVDVCMRPA